MVDYSKFILGFTDAELLEELQEIFGVVIAPPLKKPKKTWGVITNSPEEYYRDGKVDGKALEFLYSKGALVDSYFMTLAFTSLRNRPADLFKILANLQPYLNVLDFGSGAGTHSIACAQKKCNVFALDISEKMTQYVKQRFEKRKLSAHFVSSLDQVKDEKFDFIICDDVMEHVEDPVEVLKTFITLLKPNGLIHLEVSHMVNLKKGHLPQAIKLWISKGQKILAKRFKKVSSYSFRLL